MKGALLFAFIVGAGVLSAAPAANPPTIPDALDAYAQGKFDVVGSFLETGQRVVTSRPIGASGLPDDLDQLAKTASELERVGPGWIDHQGPPAAPKRRLIAATFALDIARTILNRRSLLDPLVPPIAQRFVAWGCARLRDDPHPQDVERLWDFASLNLIEARGWDAFLFGEGWPRPPRGAPGSSSATARSSPAVQNELPGELAEGHLAHVLARFPDVPEFQFAKAHAIMEAARDVGRVGVPIEAQTRDLDQEITDAYIARLSSTASAGPEGRPAASGVGRPVVATSGGADRREIAAGHVSPADEALRITELRNARTMFEHLSVSVQGPLQAEAILDAGIIALRFTDRADALQHFAAVEHLSADPAMLWYERFLSGVAHERLQEWEEAVASYRSALATAPHARMAATRLTALLLRLGRGAEAEDFENAFLMDPSGADPLANPLALSGAAASSPFAGAFDQLRKVIR
jgi:tetratricopeptide (TPR) repeat protein